MGYKKTKRTSQEVPVINYGAFSTVSASGFGTESIYVDGKLTTSLPDTSWHYITVLSDANITANTVNIGKVGSTYFNGQIDEVKIFNYALTPAQIRTEMAGGAVRFE